MTSLRRGLSSQEQLIVPMRDVLHIRLHTERARFPTPLVGLSPLLAAYSDISVGAAIAAQQTNFYRNEARPSAVLSTDLVLDKDQVTALRDRWNEQAKGMNQGGTPILTAGLKVMPWAVAGQGRGDRGNSQIEQREYRARVSDPVANSRARQRPRSTRPKSSCNPGSPRAWAFASTISRKRSASCSRSTGNRTNTSNLIRRRCCARRSRTGSRASRARCKAASTRPTRRAS